MSRLPHSWLATRLGHVIEYGATIKAEPGEIPDEAWLLELEDIEKDSSKIIRRLTYRERNSKSTKNRFTKGDVLYGKLRPYLNKVIIADSDGYCTTEIVPIKPTAVTDNRFVFYWLKHPEFVNYATEVSHGLNMPRLGTDAGKNAPFVLAPITEQKRIADKLDTLLARVAACRERLDRVQGALKHFRHSVFTAATMGELTSDFLDESIDSRIQPREGSDLARLALPALPPNWSWVSFGSLVSDIRSGSSSVPAEDRTRFPVLRSSAVRQRAIDFEDVRYFATGSRFREDDFLVDDDLLFTRLSGSLEYVANCALIRGLAGRRIQYPDRLFRARLKEPSLGPYVELCFGSPSLRRFLEVEAKSTAGHQRISMGAVTGFPIPFPPRAELDEIVLRAERLLSVADQLSHRYQAARRPLELLTASILAKAFRGELIPQDPNDEPASKLLTRLRTQGSIDVITSKPKRGGVQRLRMNAKAETNMLKLKDVLPSHLTTILKEQGALTADALWTASQLEIDDFYEQLRAEEAGGLLRENRRAPNAPILLEPSA